MFKYPKIIGVTGFARSGKDTLFKLLCQRMSCVRYAFADPLKEDIKDFVAKHYGIDILKCSPKEKELIRPLMVCHGGIKRAQTNGEHWWRQLDYKIREDSEKIGDSIVVITDLRFASTDSDELKWLKDTGGISVHLSKYTVEVVDGQVVKTFIKAPNEEEAKNDPILEQKADFKIEWPDYISLGKDEGVLYPFVNDFVHWYENR